MENGIHHIVDWSVVRTTFTSAVCISCVSRQTLFCHLFVGLSGDGTLCLGTLLLTYCSEACLLSSLCVDVPEHTFCAEFCALRQMYVKQVYLIPIGDISSYSSRAFCIVTVYAFII